MELFHPSFAILCSTHGSLFQMKFFQTTNKIFMYLLATFIVQSSKKTKNILMKTITITFIYYWPFLLCKIIKKSSQQIQIYEDAPFLGPKWAICPNENFFGKKAIIFVYLLAPFTEQNFFKNSYSG